MRVHQGYTCFPADNNAPIIEELTTTEKQILSLISCGKKRKEIAKELCHKRTNFVQSFTTYFMKNFLLLHLLKLLQKLYKWAIFLPYFEYKPYL